MLLAADVQLQLVHMPFVGRSRSAPTELVGVGRPELATPEADGLIADLDASLGEQLFDVAMAQVEPEVQPDRVADELGREAMATVQSGGRPTPRDPTRP